MKFKKMFRHLQQGHRAWLPHWPESRYLVLGVGINDLCVVWDEPTHKAYCFNAAGILRADWQTNKGK